MRALIQGARFTRRPDERLKRRQIQEPSNRLQAWPFRERNAHCRRRCIAEGENGDDDDNDDDADDDVDVAPVFVWHTVTPGANTVFYSSGADIMEWKQGETKRILTDDRFPRAGDA